MRSWKVYFQKDQTSQHHKGSPANVIRECQERIANMSVETQFREDIPNDEADQVQQLSGLFNGEGKGKERAATATVEARAYVCGVPGHFVSNCVNPQEEGAAKGGFEPKGEGNGIHAFADVSKAVGLQTFRVNEADQEDECVEHHQVNVLRDQAM